MLKSYSLVQLVLTQLVPDIQLSIGKLIVVLANIQKVFKNGKFISLRTVASSSRRCHHICRVCGDPIFLASSMKLMKTQLIPTGQINVHYYHSDCLAKHLNKCYKLIVTCKFTLFYYLSLSNHLSCLNHPLSSTIFYPFISLTSRPRSIIIINSVKRC